MGIQDKGGEASPENERGFIDHYRLDLQTQIACLQSRLIKADLELLLAVAKEREACAELVEARTESSRREASLQAGLTQTQPCQIAAAIRKRADQCCNGLDGASA